MAVRHELLREVAAELAPPSVARGRHAKVADSLVHGVGGDPDCRGPSNMRTHILRGRAGSVNTPITGNEVRIKSRCVNISASTEDFSDDVLQQQ